MTEDTPVYQPRPKFTLKLRVTERYVDRYRHLDTEQRVATAHILQESKQVTDAEDPCEPTRIIKLVEVEDEVQGDVPTIVRAIKDTMRAVGCGHEYDCCGCWSHHVVEVQQMTHQPNHYIVVQHASRNY